MIINSELIDELLERAAVNPRRREALDLRNTPDDSSQRMLNALWPDTQVAMHRHTDTSETVVVLRGKLTEVFYDDSGNETARYTLSPETGNYGLQIPVGVWHRVIVNEPCVVMEAKDGPYTPPIS